MRHRPLRGLFARISLEGFHISALLVKELRRGYTLLEQTNLLEQLYRCDVAVTEKARNRGVARICFRVYKASLSDGLFRSEKNCRNRSKAFPEMSGRDKSNSCVLYRQLRDAIFQYLQSFSRSAKVVSIVLSIDQDSVVIQTSWSDTRKMYYYFDYVLAGNTLLIITSLKG